LRLDRRHCPRRRQRLRLSRRRRRCAREAHGPHDRRCGAARAHGRALARDHRRVGLSARRGRREGDAAMGGADVITIAIPTYNRQQIAVETVVRLLPFGAPIVVVDQTPAPYEPLASLPIRLLRLPEPSIPHAMNVAVDTAATDIVLFLDDDVLPSTSLLDAHAAAHRER